MRKTFLGFKSLTIIDVITVAISVAVIGLYSCFLVSVGHGSTTTSGGGGSIMVMAFVPTKNVIVAAAPPVTLSTSSTFLLRHNNDSNNIRVKQQQQQHQREIQRAVTENSRLVLKASLSFDPGMIQEVESARAAFALCFFGAIGSAAVGREGTLPSPDRALNFFTCLDWSLASYWSMSYCSTVKSCFLFYLYYCDENS